MKIPRPIVAYSLTALAFSLVPCLAAKEINHPNQYQVCMVLAKKLPNEAFETAITWRDLGGGDAAEHCAAVALVGLGQYVEAAGRLEALAERTKQDSSVKAGLLAHAAQARLLAGQAFRAEVVLTAALKLTPGDSALLVDRAQARAERKNYRGAIQDLDQAIEREARRPDAYLFRAEARRYLGQLELALADVEKVLALQPSHAEALLERGILRRLSDDDDGARKDWLGVLRVAPKSPAADAARAYLEQMDVKPD